jgi:hypothetical protein
MKKNTTKPTNASPAPATKSVAAVPAAKKKPASAASRKKTAPAAAPAPAAVPPPVAVKPAPAPAPVASKAVPAPVAPVVAKTAPVAVPPVQRKPVVTTISARINIGFGNILTIRGEGAGLSWDAGVPMTCLADDLWQIKLGESARGFVFKVLVNDLTWNTGPDYTLASGASLTVTPEF